MLKSVFTEIINPGTKNLIVGCIYCHPCKELNKFNNFFTYLCQKLLHVKNKDRALMGDFNVDVNFSDSTNNISNKNNTTIENIN